MHGQRVEGRWVPVTRSIPRHAMLRQRGEGTARNGTVSDGGCRKGGLVLRIHGTRSCFPDNPPLTAPSSTDPPPHKQEEPYQLRLFGKSPHPIEVLTASFLPSDKQLYLAVASVDSNIHILQFDPERASHSPPSPPQTNIP